ncbi:molecular chaperone DnaK [Rubritalea squalenifaciens DSM 18772]|uniref:Molecular chaperone DnaK n=1 Tax=Rubritalea squalenifaciens DSM 18772 TaxID=1123071 RepID=A0A1M6P8T0_9BACT|nr:Hsp70 family protein [Rubritalea squalenifaciens]SHK04334.1 molecular chaperone DnaK [Rubritalea squalenifaciens DSM 18772]
MADDIIGIDLGTTNSAVGVVESGFPILLAGEDGSRIVPSAVWVGQDGDVEVGKSALHRRGAGAQVATSIKRFMGRRYAEVADEDFCVPFKEQQDGVPAFELNGGDYTAVQISAEILKHLKQVAETQLERSVSKAVITVPAYFNDAQRNATKQAGELAGLEVMRIVSEPTAAALAYGLDKLGEKSRVAVYDLGGGTFDISVLELHEGVFQVLATAGDTRLGGDDIDEALAQWCWSQLDTGESFDNLANQERQRLLDEAKLVKEKLTEADRVGLSIPFFRENFHVNLEITRDTLERVMRPVIAKTEGLCRRVLADAGIKDVEGDLNAVVLVGGSTRIPAVRDLVGRVFRREPDSSQHPDEAVAIGAVIQGGVMSGALRDMVLLDVTPLSLGIETFGGLMNVLIPRNTTIPCKAGEMFTNAIANQEMMRVRVLQGEREMARDNWELGSVDVSFDPAPKGQARVGVQFSIDENGILEVLARDVSTGKDTVLEINSAAVDVDDSDVEKMVSESVDYAFEDMAERIFTEARLKAEELLPAVEMGLAQVQDVMEPAELEEIRSAEAAVRAALEGGEPNPLKAAVQRLDKATEHMAAVLVEKAMEEALMRKLGE